MHAGKIHKVFFSVSATTTFLCVCSIAVAAVVKGYASLFLVEMLLLLIIFLVGCAAAGAGAGAAYNISTEQRGTGYCFFLLRFCPLHCDASDVYFLLLFLAAFIYVI